MPGFVDVTGWTSEEVRRLGHADDYSEDVAPQRQRRGSYTRPASVQYSVAMVWAAACAAQRINGAYLKEDQYCWDEASNKSIKVKDRNRTVMMNFLAIPGTITDQDYSAGEAACNYLQNDLTLRALKGKLTDFDQSISKVVAVQDQFDTAAHKLELAVVACLPQSHQSALKRLATTDRMSAAQGGFIGKVGDKVATNVEVISANYSKIYNIYWIKAITENNQPVFFSFKENFDSGTQLAIRGTVKAHKDNMTQLNRVKVV